MRRSLVKIEPERFMRAARRITGLSDFGETDGFRTRFEKTVGALAEIDFNVVGRLAVRTAMNWHLVNRLNMVDLLAKRPELREVDVSAPIVVVGLFRTGTTFLHNVLAADPASRAGKMWEFSYPVGRARDPLGDIKWRRRRTAIPLTMNHVIVPDQDVVHYVSADGNEEDFFMLGTDMAVMTAILGLGAWEHAFDIFDWDLEEPYRWHKLQLQALTEQRSADRWLLKCPWHMWNLDALCKVYPRARVIHIHRDIVKTIGSECSLSARIVSRMHKKVDITRLGQFWVDYSEAGLERGQRFKQALPPSQVYDVRLRALRENPAEVIKGIYEHFDLPYDDGLIARFVETAAAEPTFQSGVHEYDIADYGLEAEAIRERFADYCQQFGV